MYALVDDTSAALAAVFSSPGRLGIVFPMSLDMLDNAPANSRHIIYLKWSEEGGAHVFIAEKENGILKFVDPQSGENGVGRYLDEAIEGKFGYLRVDDKALSQDVDILKSVMKKGTK